MPKQSPLMNLHRAHGAVLAERDGWLLPDHFGDPGAEYSAVRSAIGLVDLCQRGLLQFTGADRLSFLQGMLSNDLRDLNPYEGRYAAILTQQGKVVADVRVLCAMNSFYLDLWENLTEKVIDHLNRYLVADDVEIADRSGEYTFISIQGPRSEMLLRALIGDAQLPTASQHHAMIEIERAAICVIRENRAGIPGFDLVVPLPGAIDIARKLTEAGKQFSAAWVGENAQNIIRVEAGIPRYGKDFNEENLLLEVGLEDAVSFTKGCYLGQEVIERIRSRGHVNKKLCALVLDGSAAAGFGDKIEVENKEVGRITSSVLSPQIGRPIALGYVGKGYWDPGTKLSIRSNGAIFAASIAERPFIGSY